LCLVDFYILWFCEAAVACVRREMSRREMRVAQNHLQVAPPAELLQHGERRAVLHVPARPRVTQVVPMEVAELRRFARIEPCHLRWLLNGAASIWEDPARVRPELPL